MRPASTGPAVSPGIELWFDFASSDSHLSIMRIEAEAMKHQLPVIWRPFLLGPVLQSPGQRTSPSVPQRRKGEYRWKDMARQCRELASRWRLPGRFPRSAPLALQVAMLGAEQRWIGAYCRRVARLNVALACDLEDPALVEQLLSELWLPAQQIIAEAQSETNRQALQAQTETARALGLPGAPSFIVDGARFCGNDRLDEALAYGAERRLASARHAR
ncbi:2-hydroxychromene-2-carboxylate isomerase [Nevskia sp.]|uniref:2-hydroxychromene-2-carboxylate isomerase n=1 Tax=Nevskia sp. TaxID=1929292 RepID=UPI003F71D156